MTLLCEASSPPGTRFRLLERQSIRLREELKSLAEQPAGELLRPQLEVLLPGLEYILRGLKIARPYALTPDWIHNEEARRRGWVDRQTFDLTNRKQQYEKNRSDHE